MSMSGRAAYKQVFGKYRSDGERATGALPIGARWGYGEEAVLRPWIFALELGCSELLFVRRFF